MKLTDIGFIETSECKSVNDYLSMINVDKTYKDRYLLVYKSSMNIDKWLSLQAFYTRLSEDDIFRLILIVLRQNSLDNIDILSYFYNSTTRLISNTEDEERHRMLRNLSSLIRRSNKFITLIKESLYQKTDINIEDLHNSCNLSTYVELSIIEVLKNEQATFISTGINSQNNEIYLQRFNNRLVFLGKLEDEISKNN